MRVLRTIRQPGQFEKLSLRIYRIAVNCRGKRPPQRWNVSIGFRGAYSPRRIARVVFGVRVSGTFAATRLTVLVEQGFPAGRRKLHAGTRALVCPAWA
jgi:hypothetical protein